MKISDILVETAAWKKKEGKNKNGGLNDKGIESYRKENPGSKLQKAVTKPPSEIKAGSKDDKRRKSFCARMGGMKGPLKGDDGKPTRKKLALDKWNCNESVIEAEGDCEGLPHLTHEMLSNIVQQIETEGAHAIVKSLTWGDGAAVDLLELIKADLKSHL